MCLVSIETEERNDAIIKKVGKKIKPSLREPCPPTPQSEACFGRTLEKI